MEKEKIKNYIVKYKYEIKVVFLMLLIFISIYIWMGMPFYPDELAFRISRMSYISNEYNIYNLYKLCDDDSAQIPTIFKPIAIMMSWIGQSMSSLELRLLPILTSMLLVISVASFIKNQINKDAIFLIAIGFIGISGSGHILARFEFITLMSISVCIYTISYTNNINNKEKIFKKLLIVLVTLTTITSSFIHPQGVLFIPLSVYAMFKLSRSQIKERNKQTLYKLFVILGSIYLMTVSINFNSTGCKQIKEINDNFSSMVINKEEIRNLDFIFNQIKKYSNNFIYKNEYLTNYLPGVGESNDFAVINTAIVVLVILIIIISSRYLLITIKNLILQKIQQNKKISKLSKNYWVLLIIIPALFLIIYDKNQYFYRSFFINLILCASVSIVISSYDINKFKSIKYLFTSIILILLMYSIALNYKKFYYRLSSWDAIYTVPVKVAMEDHTETINYLLKKCEINKKNGNYLIDEYTYNSLKSFPQLQIIYYVSHQGELIRKENLEVMKLLKINGVIASCDAMKRSGMGWPPQSRDENLCCFNPNK